MPKTVIIVDSVATNRIRLAALLGRAQYGVRMAASLEEFEKLPGDTDPDLVILGTGATDIGGALSGIRASRLARGVPVICIDANAGPMRRLQALRCGARDLMPRAAPDALLLARLRSVIRELDARREFERRRLTAASFGFSEEAATFDPPARIGCIGDPPLEGVLATTLRRHRIEVLDRDTMLRGDDGLQGPDAYVVSMEGKDMEALLPELRDRSHSRDAPILVLYPQGRPEAAAHALNLGANDVVPDDASGQELALRIESLLSGKRLNDTIRRSAERSYHMAATDPLTGLFNRRYAEAYLADVVFRSAETGRSFVVMLVDIDHFKAVNDRHGHLMGDRVLAEVAKSIRENLRVIDLVARYGGEEFLVVLPETGVEDAELAAERLRRTIAGKQVALQGGAEIAVTVSIGVAVGSVPADAGRHALVRTGTFDEAERAAPHILSGILDAADLALYRAKNGGRNRVEFSPAA